MSSNLLLASFLLVQFAYLYCTLTEAGGIEVPLKQQIRAKLREKAEAHVAKINAKKERKWTAKLNSRFAEMPKEEQRRWLGLKRDPFEQIKIRQERMAGGVPALLNVGNGHGNGSSTTPKPDPGEYFDAREEWPECADVMNQIQDQSGCGSCWAVASASVMQDRICIGSKGSLKMNVSSEDILSCERKSFGCDGGYPDNAFEFWHSKGVCSGGEYGSKKGCKPYPFPPHADHLYQTPRCKHRCENRYYKSTYRKDKNYGLNPVNMVDGSEEEIMDAILKGGPVEADMIVYTDFFHYHSGVYEHDKDSEVAGGHAVRIIGWGYDNTTDADYWLVANSWNMDWGDNGFFKIVRGQDECQIETWGINYAEPNLADTAH